MRIDMDRVLAAAESDEQVGFCTACGEEAEGWNLMPVTTSATTAARPPCSGLRNCS